MTPAEWAAAWARRGDTATGSRELNERLARIIADGRARGGLRCCGTTGVYHEPFCYAKSREMTHE